MADAPSFRTSTRSKAAMGIWFTSTADPVSPCAATRRPFKSTRVDADPCPRRLAADKPFVPRCAPLVTSALDARLSAPFPFEDRYEISCSGLLIPSRDNSSVFMICSGSELSVGSRLMREPVTMMAAASSACGSADAGVSWANAGNVRHVAASNEIDLVNFMFFPLFGKQPGNFFLSLVRRRGYSRNFANATRLM